jgi:hypothetical protein
MTAHAERIRYEDQYRRRAANIAADLAALLAGVNLASVMPRVVDYLTFFVHRSRYDLARDVLHERISAGLILQPATPAEIAQAVGLRANGGYELPVVFAGRQGGLNFSLALALSPPKKGAKYDLGTLALARDFSTGRETRSAPDTMRWDICLDVTEVYAPLGSRSLAERTRDAFSGAAQRGGVADRAFFDELFPPRLTNRFDLQHVESLLDVWTDPTVPAHVNADGWPAMSAALMVARIMRHHEYVLLYEAIRKMAQNEVRQAVGRGGASFDLDVWLDNEVDRRRKRKPAGDGITDARHFLISPFDASDPEWSPPTIYSADPGAVVSVAPGSVQPDVSAPDKGLFTKLRDNALDGLGRLGLDLKAAPVRPLLNLGDKFKPLVTPKSDPMPSPPSDSAPQTVTGEMLLAQVAQTYGTDGVITVLLVGLVSYLVCELVKSGSGLGDFDVQGFAASLAPLASALGVADLCALGGSILSAAYNLGLIQ